MLDNAITTGAPEAAERCCPTCGGALPRPNSIYCCCRCSAIGRENQKREGQPRPQSQAPILFRELERLSADMRSAIEFLLGFRADVMPLLREVLERLGKQEPSESKLLSMNQAARYLNINRHTLRRLLLEGQLHYLRIGRLVMFKRTELANFIERRNHTYSPRRP